MLPQFRYPLLLFLASVILLLAGMLWQICGWPGVRLITGVMLLLQIIAVVRLLSMVLSTWYALVFIMGVIVMIAGLMFRIMHWPNAQLVFGSAAIVDILIVVRLFVALLKKQEVPG